MANSCLNVCSYERGGVVARYSQAIDRIRRIWSIRWVLEPVQKGGQRLELAHKAGDFEPQPARQRLDLASATPF